MNRELLEMSKLQRLRWHLAFGLSLGIRQESQRREFRVYHREKPRTKDDDEDEDKGGIPLVKSAAVKYKHSPILINCLTLPLPLQHYPSFQNKLE